MQRQYTIEFRVDFSEDEDKNAEIETTLRQCAKRALATARMIAGNPKAAQVVIWSDDFYSGFKEISLMSDQLGEVTEENANEDGDEPSAEMLEALSSSNT